MTKLAFNAGQERGSANGTKIPFTMVLEDDDGHPVTNGELNIAFDPKGVGRLDSNDGRVPETQCAKRNSISSDDPGVATIKASVGNVSQQREFVFTLPTRRLLIAIALAIGGGAAGAFVKAGLDWPRSRRWRASRWLVTLSSGALIGLCVFLAYYYGVAAQIPSLAAAEGTALMLGMIGGYLGRVAMDEIARRVFPLAKG